ncbi:MAG: pal [Labilithrix sp.]|nr:pal [Labilithrix sp.]
MANIPVQKKSGLPAWWIWVLGLLVAALLLFVLLRSRGDDAARAVNDGTPAVVAATPTDRATTTSAKTCKGDQECAAKELCIDSACRGIDASTSICSTATAHFATDSAELDSAQKQGLERVARCLRADRSMKLTIEGNADQRGAAAHNDDLADKRARAVAQELTGRGVTPAQLNVVSYGDNHLLCAANDEACWSKNRRTEVQPKK